MITAPPPPYSGPPPKTPRLEAVPWPAMDRLPSAGFSIVDHSREKNPPLQEQLRRTSRVSSRPYQHNFQKPRSLPIAKSFGNYTPAQRQREDDGLQLGHADNAVEGASGNLTKQLEGPRESAVNNLSELPSETSPDAFDDADEEQDPTLQRGERRKDDAFFVASLIKRLGVCIRAARDDGAPVVARKSFPQRLDLMSPVEQLLAMISGYTTRADFSNHWRPYAEHLLNWAFSEMPSTWKELSCARKRYDDPEIRVIGNILSEPRVPGGENTHRQFEKAFTESISNHTVEEAKRLLLSDALEHSVVRSASASKSPSPSSSKNSRSLVSPFFPVSRPSR